jgi:hypothetical protein
MSASFFLVGAGNDCHAAAILSREHGNPTVEKRFRLEKLGM